jgi:hypothetical protein
MRAVERPEEESANQFGGVGLISTAGKVWSIKSESCWIGVGPDPDGSVSAA